MEDTRAIDAWHDAKRAHLTGAISDAELACVYVKDRVRRASGVRWRQGQRKPHLGSRDAATLPEAVRAIAYDRLRCVELPAARALVAWFEGARDVELSFAAPAPEHVLALQARGRRCVSLLEETAVTPPHADGLAFALHDLCHLEKFVEVEHHHAQIGFFSRVHEATLRPEWRTFDARYDAAWRSDFEHVACDMNGSPVFLLAALKMKLKMAARRKLAVEHGRPAPTGGPLSPEESSVFADALEDLFDLLRLHGDVRDAARAVSTKRDSAAAALRIVAFFASLGAAIKAR